jgi:hypothetical protein
MVFAQRDYGAFSRKSKYSIDLDYQPEGTASKVVQFGRLKVTEVTACVKAGNIAAKQ